jgi:hypothetical protein
MIRRFAAPAETCVQFNTEVIRKTVSSKGEMATLQLRIHPQKPVYG